MSATAKLLLVRHGVALDAEDAARMGREDARRPLTDVGRDKMREAVAGLRRLLPQLDIIAASPYLRAAQTADLVAEAYPSARRETLQVLAPGGEPSVVLAWRDGLERDATVAVIGHEPDLGLLASVALAGASSSFVTMKKGGCCLVGFDGPVDAGQGRLLWSLPPKALRGLSRP